MQPFTFVHAADLHLDAVLPGPGAKVLPAEADGGACVRLLREAVFMALDRLVDLCLREKAAFLLLAGDVFHRDEGSLKACFALREACLRLGEEGVEVFWARGNHDFAAWNTEILSPPDNLRVFSREGEAFPAGSRGKALALVRGISHSGPGERENLARKLAAGAGPEKLFQIGLLHCAVRGGSAGHEVYAPCEPGDFKTGSLDYWALGHVHAPGVVSPAPLAIYPGSLQGLHINESGPHGCYLARVDALGRTRAFPVPLAPVRWENIEFDLHALSEEDASGRDSLESLEKALLEILEDMGEKAAPALALLCRLELRGRSRLDSFLRREENLDELTLRLNLALAGKDARPCLIRVKDIALRSSPDSDLEALRRSDNLVGETLRKAEAFIRALEDPEGPEEDGMPLRLLAELEKLYADPRCKDYLARPDSAELAELARAAVVLCLDLFEADKC
ncbi:MAG: DNA repair exonuclease [Deltaproteobacteria bacterium]|jgi:DNA repair exonuclease SbcCD nuclease subunit|nr:DNA repair exonuclease [Deltaproteobacteria bacterium]